MSEEITLNLCSDIREAVTPILEQIRALGWHVSVIEWKSKSALTVKFTGALALRQGRFCGVRRAASPRATASSFRRMLAKKSFKPRRWGSLAEIWGSVFVGPAPWCLCSVLSRRCM
jgi:hypothetical protein